jgi:hypothetical protein
MAGRTPSSSPRADAVGLRGEFVIYLLRTYSLQLTRVGGSGDEGIDGSGFAPITPVLSSPVADRRSATSLTRPSRMTSSRSSNETPSRREPSPPCW